MNRSKLKKSLYKIAQPVSLKRLIQSTNKKLIFPFYHAVSDYPPAHLKHIFKVNSIQHFKNDIEFLLKFYQPASLSEIIEYAQLNKKPTKPLFYLTFDDGFAECHSTIAPILEHYGLEATFFINPQFVDNNFFSHRLKISWLIEEIINNADKEDVVNQIFSTTTRQEAIKRLKKITVQDVNLLDVIAQKMNIDISSKLKQQQPYMTSEQIKDLKKRGFSIGSHSFSHPEFHLIDADETQMQLKSSFDYLEKIIPEQPRLFSFPFSDDGVSAETFQYIYNNMNVVVSFGTAGVKNDIYPQHFHRIAMENETFDSGKQIIKSEYFYYLAKIPFGKNVKKRL